MAITDKEEGVWNLDEAYNKQMAGYWSYDTSITGLFSWGRNYGGALGLNEGTARSSPTQVGTDSTWKYLGPNNEAKGVTAIKTDGTLWAWGNNDKGTLGHNNTTAYSSPKQVGTDTTWSTTTSSMAVKTDGSLWSWGYNFLGNMGTNDRVPRSSPIQVGYDTTWGILNASVSRYGVAAIKTDGTLWQWGKNTNSGMGINAPGNFSSPKQIPGTTWKEVGIGDDGARIAVKTDGTAWAWGDNSQGQSGVNNETEYSSPIQIPGTSWLSVSARRLASMAIKQI